MLLYTLSAFGGPQGHLMLMIKHFVYKRQYISEKELIEYNSFCQLIPGPSSTQLLGIIAYKKGGFWLSLLTLLLWILPASIFMGILSFFITDESYSNTTGSIFKYIQPLTLAFLLYSMTRYFSISIRNTITRVIFLYASIFTLLFFNTPWIIPILIIFGGVLTNLSNKRIPEIPNNKEPIRINWKPLLFYILIFLTAALLSETARKQDWENRKQYNLFENNYRFGSFVFGGGDVLLPLMIDQYVERPTSRRIKKTQNINIIKIEKNNLITGFGIVKAIPGPVFSVSAYAGGLALSKNGRTQQALGCIIGAVSIFLPSIILLYFIIPFWEKIKNLTIVYRSLEGINATITGVMMATAIYLMNGTVFHVQNSTIAINGIIVAASFILLLKTKIPPPLIVIAVLIIGWFF